MQPDNSLWDELMGFVTGPMPDEPTDEPKGIVVGRLNDDGEGDDVSDILGLAKAPSWRDSYGIVHINGDDLL